MERQPKPLTYLRQVLALMLDPRLLARVQVEPSGLYPADVVRQAKNLLAAFPGGSVGSYTHTGGQLFVRQACADYFTRRDGDRAASQVADVHVTCGSTEAIRLLLEGFGRRRPAPAAVLVPAPGRPIYAGFAEQVGVLPVAYSLQTGWQLDEALLDAAYLAAVEAGAEPRLLVLQNPGSPTGQLLTPASLHSAANFARRHRLLVIADETLQFAIYTDEQFVGFRRVALELQEQQQDGQLEVASLASLSEGLCGGGEAGLRIGFCELLNFHPAAKDALLAVLACTSCPPSIGQAALAAYLAPPQPGDESYAAYSAELSSAAAGYRRKCALVVGALTAESGIASLAPLPGAGGRVYAQMRLPAQCLIGLSVGSAAAAAAAAGPNYDNEVEAADLADAAYCAQLVQGDSDWLQPGSRFGQRPVLEGPTGSFYVSIDIKCSEPVLLTRLNRLVAFHREIVQQFA